MIMGYNYYVIVVKLGQPASSNPCIRKTTILPVVGNGLVVSWLRNGIEKGSTGRVSSPSFWLSLGEVRNSFESAIPVLG